MCADILFLDPLPVHIEAKARRIVLSMRSRGCDLPPNWKKIKARRTYVRCKLNRGYRLVVDLNCLDTGPYWCMKHSTFDKRF